MPEKILISGAILIPLDDEAPAFFRGDLLVEGGLIVSVKPLPAPGSPVAGRGSAGAAVATGKAGAPGTALTGAAPQADRVIDGSGLLVMPGLVNTHGHAAMSLFRGYADDLPLMEWLERKIWPVEEKLHSDDVYWGAMLSIAEMLKGGTTTFADMYFFMDRVAEAVAESGIRAVLARGLIGVSASAGEALADAERFAREWHGRENGRVTVHLGPHAPYTCPPDFMRRVMDAAARTGLPMHIHLAETAGEVERSLAEHGCSPVQLMDRLGLFQYPVTAAHCVHLDDADIAALAAGGAGVAHNPGSNLKLGSGIAPAVRLLEAGVKVGLGTDGAGSNNNLDLLEEMRLAALLPKGLSRNPTRMPAADALKMATAGGAAALFLAGVGRLREGWRADIVAFNTGAPHLNPLFDPAAQVVYAAASSDVSLVMVDGRILVEGGRLTGLDEERITAEASRRAYRLTGREPL